MLSAAPVETPHPDRGCVQQREKKNMSAKPETDIYFINVTFTLNSCRQLLCARLSLCKRCLWARSKQAG